MSSSRQVQHRGTIGGVAGSSKGRGGRAGSADSVEVQGAFTVEKAKSGPYKDGYPRTIGVGYARRRRGDGRVQRIEVEAHPWRNEHTGRIEVEFFWTGADTVVQIRNFQAMPDNTFDDNPAEEYGFFWDYEFCRSSDGHGVRPATRPRAIADAWQSFYDGAVLDTAPYKGFA